MPSYSGLWNGLYGVNYTALGTNNTKEFNNTDKVHLTKVIARTRGGRVLATVMKALNGAAAGDTATMTAKQIANDSNPANPIGNGGKRVVATKTDINRATTAADETMIDLIYDRIFAPSPYPVDKSRNGGGNKAGRF